MRTRRGARAGGEAVAKTAFTARSPLPPKNRVLAGLACRAHARGTAAVTVPLEMDAMDTLENDSGGVLSASCGRGSVDVDALLDGCLYD